MACSSAAETRSTYALSAEPAIRQLVDNARSEDWRERVPQLAAYSYDHFDYQADDRLLEISGTVGLAM